MLGRIPFVSLFCVALAAALGGCGGRAASVPGTPAAAQHPSSSKEVGEATARALKPYYALMSHGEHGLSGTAANRRRTQSYGGAMPTTTVNVVWQVALNNTDRMSAFTAAERDISARFSDGQTWYLPAAQISGTAPLYRLYRPYDHMDSNTPGEGGYGTEGVLGYAYASGVSGTTAINRWVKWNGDHATPSNPYMPLGGLGYSQEGAMGYGYPRYGNNLYNLTTFSGGGITAAVNNVAGAAVWSWQWNGVEFVSNQAGSRYYTFGNQIQAAFFWDGQGVVQNPTEAGDGACCFAGSSQKAADMHGSPVASLSLTPDSSGISTRALPLDWNTPPIAGSAANQAELYPNILLGKDIQLNYGGLGPVAKWTTSLTLPAAITTGNRWLEMPTGYVQPTFASYYTYDAASDALSGVAPPLCNPSSPGSTTPLNFAPASGYGGVIVSSSTGTAAQGVYARTYTVGGKVGTFAMWDFVHNGCPWQFSKWDAITRTDVDFAANETQYTSYVVTGTLAQVRQLMHSLYAGGAL